ncbi:30S ribosomal protein S5 [candidate division WWE3 bacterium RIFOXYC1_FULL_40_10]|uniref:Small ribosomal subunit protein uS5 n=1 Tax=candidate division WWE3 bacterium RIFOXYA2_FULL_46_9 TaxID=1802636 RepID=A0A1F4VYX4_UNCKA|nr:MAG: 30S ribosomal protein S5 [candidate division WWE3 bacterium RIFOXYB1_FULL_40_22]OGC61853.1 MAG: 30S ribosomal protein S5 [candidate division WWE3 bacterium RIFOXYA1_FULL_40_11]OGC62218.1 MAG: 30S ribosomal protein S5 [candidate division WWE3 bacterium RIFOXYA2_FULL_46_9]OGC64325.1 MAG: 30S ribosomal protein S5 [candidate division WWE3 bacterium RIFOXYB2_FULL_41_6]OGC66236.1 MAG: 30S ribosomal protein S5 [candidate division WWE3 bacterium RIFOXYC1_FULL_40_10]OGC67842.1 MAG: 30S ribosoma
MNFQPSEFEEKVLQIRRVTKKITGGSAISFTALVVVGDKKGRVGVGYGKAKDVSSAISKAIKEAKSELVTVSLKDNTIAHEVEAKLGAARVLLKPAAKGSGIIAGGPVRTVIELAGIRDVSGKMINASNNKISNARCAIKALKKLKVFVKI